jgi:hypothetical protein
MLGSPTRSMSRSICPTSTSRPPMGRRRAASSMIAQYRGGCSRVSSPCRPIRSATRRSTSSGSRSGMPWRMAARAYSSVCSRPGRTESRTSGSVAQPLRAHVVRGHAVLPGSSMPDPDPGPCPATEAAAQQPLRQGLVLLFPDPDPAGGRLRSRAELRVPSSALGLRRPAAALIPAALSRR